MSACRVASAAIFAALLLLAGCARVSDLFGGGQAQRPPDRPATAARPRPPSTAAAKPAPDKATAAATERQKAVAAMRARIADLDRSLQAIQAQMTRARAGKAETSAHDAHLWQVLESTKAWLGNLQGELAGDVTPAGYETAQRDYQSLQDAIQALHEQVEGERL